jgi:hypothetical protein
MPFFLLSLTWRKVMKFSKIVLASAMLLSSVSVLAGEANVTFGDLSKFTDVRPANETRSGFQKRVVKQFTKEFEKLAEQLPEGYKLGVTVNDIDLAGDVLFGGGTEMRVIKSVYWPRIKFSFVLTDASSKIVDKGEANIKDMSFMDKIRMGREESFMYEKRLINDWFNEEIKPKVPETK